ncbi:MAG: tRNA glutamyl-Q(34) synthetase GluQRS [Gammaproteobacteria bacterium]|nr:MAG: tRNA glutamyl-Q(34) synthetase GluQRS [Gammaproteobacteria bacterium]
MKPPTVPRGRFAPSPTGPLHMGSLVAALGSFLNVRQQDGEWLVRIDDIDTPRNVPQMEQAILLTLEQHALQWDGDVYYSSQHLVDYEQVLRALQAAGQVFPCTCSRREISNHPINNQRQTGDTLIYPGTCRAGVTADKPLRSYRLRVPTSAIEFMDLLQGPQADTLAISVGDFVVKDGQGQHHYQLATVVDDQIQQITEVVRGADLLASTARQIHLQNRLGYRQPKYLHLSLVTDALGIKLSKQHGATAVDNTLAGQNLITALTLLQQQPPDELQHVPPAGIIRWAIEHWNREPLKSFPIATLPTTLPD